MASDLAFIPAALSPAAWRHIRVFQMHQFLDRFAMGLTVSVVALALADRGMDLFQISLLFGVYALTTLTLELPFGGLADSVGRKPVFLAAVVASVASVLLFLPTREFGVLALSFACIGLGRALRSGTLDAWFVETFRATAPGVDVQPALARAHAANALGLATGAVTGGLLPDVFGAAALERGFSPYDLSYAASLVVMLGVFAYTRVAIVEPPRPRNPRALMQGVAAAPRVIAEASRLALRDPALALLLAAMGCFLMATNPVEVLWPTHVKPMLEVATANTVIGALTAGYFFAIALGAHLSPQVSRLFRRRHARTLGGVFAGLAVVQVALAWQGGVAGFAALFLIYSVLLGMAETPASSLLHARVADRHRSTLLSLRSLIQQLGAALGLLLTGLLAEATSTPVAWSLSAAALGLAAGLAFVLAGRLATGPH